MALFGELSFEEAMDLS